ncbi:MAG: electron transfer flavoprotein subunit beta, partial [Chloroflexi bacterium]|nr:electron transfer flavoprotein subunit beta [Chloroflexota bacterium]
LKRLAQKEEVAMVITGKQTIDGDTAQVGPGIATRLGYSQLTLVDRIDSVDIHAKKVKCRRKLEGRHEIVEAQLPVMISVLREINHPRYPTVPMRLMSADAPVNLWDNNVMGLDKLTIGLNGSATQVRKIFSPERAKGQILGNGLNAPEEAAELLINKLVEKDLLFL